MWQESRTGQRKRKIARVHEKANLNEESFSSMLGVVGKTLLQGLGKMYSFLFVSLSLTQSTEEAVHLLTAVK
jgi:hypothetical protein